MRSSAWRMAALALVTALVSAFAALATPALASVTRVAPGRTFAAEASRYQNSVIARALVNNRTGTRVAANKVEWKNGAVVMVVPVTPDASPGGNCPTGFAQHWACVFNQTQWNGTMLEFHDMGYYQDLYSYGGSSWVTRSYYNYIGVRTWLNQYASHTNSGASLCMSPDSLSGNYSGPAEHDEWIYVSTNSLSC